MTKPQRCATDGCDLLSVNHTHCVAHRDYDATDWDCQTCGWHHKPGSEHVCRTCERITSKCRCGWDCRKCGWVHHPSSYCACPPGPKGQLTCRCCNHYQSTTTRGTP